MHRRGVCGQHGARGRAGEVNPAANAVEKLQKQSDSTSLFLGIPRWGTT